MNGSWRLLDSCFWRMMRMMMLKIMLAALLAALAAQLAVMAGLGPKADDSCVGDES
jgi:hypothetical protein